MPNATSRDDLCRPVRQLLKQPAAESQLSQVTLQIVHHDLTWSFTSLMGLRQGPSHDLSNFGKSIILAGTNH